MRLCLLHAFGLLMAAALIFPTPVCAEAIPSVPCPAVAHPHMDPHRRMPDAFRVEFPTERLANFGPDGGGNGKVPGPQLCAEDRLPLAL